MNHPIITHDGKQYRLIEDAYYGGDSALAYEAYAICLQDTPDEDGYQPEYQLYWDIKDEYIDYDLDTGRPFIASDAPDDVSELVDWEHPTGVLDSGMWNPTTGCGY